MPSSKHIILAALENHVHTMIELGTMEPEVLEHMPESHVFYASDMYEYDEGDFEAVRMIGEQDVQNKINYLAKVIDQAAAKGQGK